MRKKGPTIKDVAAHAGVSVMAVSRVCNPGSNGQVSEAMRVKVQMSIETLGYQPDTVAQSLRRRRSDTVGFYNGYRGTLLLNEEFPRNVFAGLQDKAAELDQDLLVFNVPEEERPESEIVRELSTSKVDGVIFLPREGDEGLAELLGESHQNVVALGEALPGLPAITAQDAEGSRALAEHLHSRGHRNVIYRCSKRSLTSANRRYEAFLEAATEMGMSVRATRTTLVDDDLDEAEMSTIRECAAAGFTAIAAWHDFSAVKALLYCRELGLRIPEDMAITGFDRLTPMLCPADVSLTTVEVDWTDVARRAVAYVVKGRNVAARPDLGDHIIDTEGRFEIAVASNLYVGNTT